MASRSRAATTVTLSPPVIIPVAKVESHFGELSTRVCFILTIGSLLNPDMDVCYRVIGGFLQ